MGANTESRSAQNTNTATAKKSRHLPSRLGCPAKVPGVPSTLNGTAGANAHPFPTDPQNPCPTIGFYPNDG